MAERRVRRGASAVPRGPERGVPAVLRLLAGTKGIAALAVDGGWPQGAFPAVGLAAEPDETRAKLWDGLWAAHESARLRLHPMAR